MTHETEFPDFTLDVAIPATWRDTSWKNDVCPSWVTPNGSRVFVDYADPARREFPDSLRFTVTTEDESGVADMASDDWEEVLRATA